MWRRRTGASRPFKHLKAGICCEALFLELMQKEEKRQREVEQWWAQVDADARAFEAESREVGKIGS